MIRDNPTGFDLVCRAGRRAVSCSAVLSKASALLGLWTITCGGCAGHDLPPRPAKTGALTNTAAASSASPRAPRGHDGAHGDRARSRAQLAHHRPASAGCARKPWALALRRAGRNRRARQSRAEPAAALPTARARARNAKSSALRPPTSCRASTSRASLIARSTRRFLRLAAARFNPRGCRQPPRSRRLRSVVVRRNTPHLPAGVRARRGASVEACR